MDKIFEAKTPKGDVVLVSTAERDCVEALTETGGTVVDEQGRVVRRFDAAAVPHILDRIDDELTKASDVPRSREPVEVKEPTERSVDDLFHELSEARAPSPQRKQADPMTLVSVAAPIVGAMIALRERLDGETVLALCDLGLDVADKLIRKAHGEHVRAETSHEGFVAIGSGRDNSVPPGKRPVQSVDERTGQVRAYKSDAVGKRRVIRRYE